MVKYIALFLGLVIFTIFLIVLGVDVKLLSPKQAFIVIHYLLAINIIVGVIFIAIVGG